MNDRDYRDYEPVPEEEMDFRNPEKTVCELLRKTYHMSKNDQVRYNLRVAMAMTKKMGAKLGWYRSQLGYSPMDGVKEWK